MEFGHAQWRKSSYSTDQTACVEIAYPDWRKSSFSGSETACVEIAHPTGSPMVGIRDSKNPTAGHLTLPATALHHLTRGLLG